MRLRQTIQRFLLKGYDRLRTGVAYDIYDPRYVSDPYPLLARLRSRDPVHRSHLSRAWVFTRYADQDEILKDPRFSVDKRNSRDYEKMLEKEIRAGPTEVDAEQPASMLRSDPPDHDRLRGLVSSAFTLQSVRALQPRIEAIVHEHLDLVQSRGEMDVIRDLASPLPVIVIAEILGVPIEDRDLLKHWSDEFVVSLGFPTLSETLRIQKASRQLKAYFQEIAAKRRTEPRPDLISALVVAEEQGDRVNSEEILEMCQLLLISGHETTTNLIGNGMLALLRHPDQLAALQRDPSLIESAVEEIFRYDGPLVRARRRALEDCAIAGVQIRKGEELFLYLAAANRDPERFVEPDAFDITRADNSHLALGRGIHFCLGASLARLEAKIAIGAMVERLPNMKLTRDRLEWRRSLILRGLLRLPVRF